MKATLNKTKDRQTEDRAKHNRKMVESYAIQVSPLSEDDGGGFQALYPPLVRSVVGYGATTQEAIADLQIMVPTFLKMLAKTDQTLPEIAVEKDWDEFSGKFNVRVTRALHYELVTLAADQGVSLNSLVQTILTSGATALAAGMMFGASAACVESPAVKQRNGSSADHAKD